MGEWQGQTVPGQLDCDGQDGFLHLHTTVLGHRKAAFINDRF